LGFVIFNYDKGAFINPTIQYIIISGPEADNIITQINKAKDNIKLQALGEINTFLGINISIDYKNNKLHIHQNNYTRSILEKYNKNNLYPKNNPLTANKLQGNIQKALQEEITIYQQYIGSLLYLALKTRPDIAFTVQNCARYYSNPRILHFQTVNNIFGYLNKYPNLGITYTGVNNHNLIIKAYSDSD